MFTTTSFVIILVLIKETQAYSRKGFLRHKQPCAENQLLRSKLAFLKIVDSQVKQNYQKNGNTQIDTLENAKIVVHNDADLQVDTNGSVKNRNFVEVLKKRTRNRYKGRHTLVRTLMRLRTF